jgi:Na+-translocating ferredoxin:NAD+ oxidoreductase subunit B
MTESLIAIVTLVSFAFICGGLLGYSSVKFKVEGDPIVEKINQLLPQTQCGQCGHPGCKPYAEAISQGEAINRCPPGGEAGIKALAELLVVDVIPLDQDCGEESLPRVAYIIEDECIGCTKCIQACPVDAIVGAPKMMHTVITTECTGCDLCVAPCPVDCIEMPVIETNTENWLWPKPNNPATNSLNSSSNIISVKQI